MVVRGLDVFIVCSLAFFQSRITELTHGQRNPDGSEEPVNASTAVKPALSTTWFPSLVYSLTSKVLGRRNENTGLNNDEPASDVEDTDGESSGVSDAKSGTATPLEGRPAAVKAGGKRRKAIRKK